MTNNELLAEINTERMTSYKAAQLFTQEFCRGLNQQDVRVFMIAADKRKALAVARQNERVLEGRMALGRMINRQADRWESIFTNLYECYSY